MADLDDFFAKKDKKKKTKKGFSKANTDVLAKTLEEQDRRDAKADEGKILPLATSEALQNKMLEEQQQMKEGEGKEQEGKVGGLNDEEWLDYSNEKKDYSGLKIESLKVSDSNEKGGEEDEGSVNEEGEGKGSRGGKRGEGGPWRKNQAQQQNDDEDDDEDDDNSLRKPSPTPESQEPSPAPSDSSSDPPKKSYVPPHLRNAPPSNSTSSNPSSLASGGPSLAPVRLGGGGSGGIPRRSRLAPDITSQMAFPSLSATAEERAASKGGRDDFEEVRSGAGASQSAHRGANAGSSTDAPRLALGNKFDALRD